MDIDIVLLNLCQMLQAGQKRSSLVRPQSCDVVGAFAEHVQQVEYRQDHLHVT